MPRVAVDRGQAPSDVRVVERAEPAAARCGIVLEPGADGLDDDDVGEAGGDRLAAESHAVVDQVVKVFGAVVTGTLVAGDLSVGEEVVALPSGRRARVHFGSPVNPEPFVPSATMLEVRTTGPVVPMLRMPDGRVAAVRTEAINWYGNKEDVRCT